MTSTTHDTFLLLNLPDCTLKTPTTSQTGTLRLERVSLTPSNVFLVLRLNEQEIPLNNVRTVTVSQNSNGERVYVFHGTETDRLVVTLIFSESSHTEDSLKMFDRVLGRYLTLNRDANTPSSPSTPPRKDEDLRGRLLLRDEDTGEIVGEFDQKVVVREDPVLSKEGHENDPVVIEIPRDATSATPESAIEAFAISVPPDQHDWITRNATLFSHKITEGTNLLLQAIDSASSRYTAQNSTPSTSPAPSQSNEPPNQSEKSLRNPQPPAGPSPLFSTPEQIRKGLAKAHAISGQAAEVSSQTRALIEYMIYRAIGGRSKKGREKNKPDSAAPRKTGTGATNPSSNLAQPPRKTTFVFLFTNISLRSSPLLSPDKLGTTDRIILSRNLILLTIQESAKKIYDTSTDRVGTVIRVRYGEDAAESSAAIASTVRNIGLVYIDLQGIGRKAILKRVAEIYVNGRSKKQREQAVSGRAFVAGRTHRYW
ncbi:hypothetical protein V5O48_015337 [Marasmius crinis-equi]|uniref:Senescence domain-containing protein n=1 Tax=Marasmius crinis-equi TaxID=585013 RepID=A0ABR3EUT2_9AGAR